MALDTDIDNADSKLHVEFYLHERKPYVGVPFVRIMAPGDKTNIYDQPVKEEHKERFPRQWLYFQMQQQGIGDGVMIGTPLIEWHRAAPEELTQNQLAELQILKFQNVEQVATMSDGQAQRIGMGGPGLRERARNYLQRRNRAEVNAEHEQTKRELEELKRTVAQLLATNVNKPLKGDHNGRHDAATRPKGDG